MHERNEGGNNRMRKSQRDKRTYLIIGLCAIVVVMAVGFAAFSSQLQTNGTSEITSTWCVGFDTTKTSDYVATPGLSGASAPTASMSYSGNTCGSDNLQTGASMSASFKQPGDQVVYTFTIKNASSLNAKLDSITENLTTSNSAIEYILSGAKANDILGPNDTTTLVVTVRYKSSVTSQPETTTWGLELKLNFSQTNDSPAPVAPATNFVYAYNTGTRTIGTSTVTDGVSDYTQLSSYQSGKTWFLKYELDGNNVIQNAWACQKFSFINEPVCLQGGNASYYTANRGIIEGLANTFTSNGGSCSAADSSAYCNVGDLYVDAYSPGSASAYGRSANKRCRVDNYGSARCY